MISLVASLELLSTISTSICVYVCQKILCKVYVINSAELCVVMSTDTSQSGIQNRVVKLVFRLDFFLYDIQWPIFSFIIYPKYVLSQYPHKYKLQSHKSQKYDTYPFVERIVDSIDEVVVGNIYKKYT